MLARGGSEEADFTLAFGEVQANVNQAGFGVADALVDVSTCVTDEECVGAGDSLALEYGAYVPILDAQISALEDMDVPEDFPGPPCCVSVWLTSYLRPAIIALLAAAVLVLAADDARSQVLLLTLDTPNPQAGVLFGDSLAMGDGDGRADLLVGAPFEDVGANVQQGRAYLFALDSDGDEVPTTGGQPTTATSPTPSGATPTLGASPTLTDDEAGDGDGAPVGAIAGGVLGGVLLLAVGGGAGYWCLRIRKT